MRAGRALRDQWAAEARAVARAADPQLAAADAAERAAMNARDRVFQRYGRLVQAAARREELSYEEAAALIFAARERTAHRLSAQQRRIFGGR